MKLFPIKFVVVLLFISCFFSCTTVEVINPTDAGSVLVDIGEGNVNEIETYNGEVGVIIDVRSIYRKGYSPQKAKISLPNYERFNTTLDIVENLNIAVLRIPNDSLTEQEKIDFEDVVLIEIEISDDDQVLETFEGEIILDAVNNPLSLQTELDFIPHEIRLNENLPYFMIFNKEWGDLNYPSDGLNIYASYGSSGAEFEIQSFENTEYAAYRNFYFQHVEGNKYKIRLPSVCEDFEGNYIECPEDNWVGYKVILEGGWIAMLDQAPSNIWYPYLVSSNDDQYVSIFELQEKENGWLEMFYVNQVLGLQPWRYWRNGNMWFGTDLDGISTAEIRLVSDNIDYQLEDLGTIYYDPIIPSQKVDFAYFSTIRNCSATQITEEVGRIETLTRTTSTATTESFQLFSSEKIGVSVKVGTEITGRAGGGEATGGSYFETSMAIEVIGNVELQTTSTQTTEKMMQNTITEQIEVSRIRTASVQPYSGVELFDYVKSADNVRVPYIRTLKISGRDRFFNTNLSGAELAGLAIGNLFGGIITKVENDHIEVTIRGNALTNSFFESFSGANDISAACSE